jgi:hypothetical protein
MYPTVHFTLFFNTKYKNYDYNKKCYIIKNIIKSLILGYISVDAFNLLSNAYVDIWDNKVLNEFATIYVANDIVGLLLIPKLPFTTKIHHLTSAFFLIYSYHIEFNEPNIGRLLFILCIFSCFSFLVNFYLAIRYLENKEDKILTRSIDVIRRTSYYIYIVCCVINWCIQLIYIYHRVLDNTFDYTYCVYLGLLAFIINDDLILMSWLRNQNTIKND